MACTKYSCSLVGVPGTFHCQVPRHGTPLAVTYPTPTPNTDQLDPPAAFDSCLHDKLSYPSSPPAIDQYMYLITRSMRTLIISSPSSRRKVWHHGRSVHHSHHQGCFSSPQTRRETSPTPRSRTRLTSCAPMDDRNSPTSNDTPISVCLWADAFPSLGLFANMP